MKHDPACEPPELWILKSTGSFSFEFMSGGRAIVCGHDSQTLPSVLGERPCVGMVGGVVYFRGQHGELPEDVILQPLDEADVAWLSAGLDEFLNAICQPKLKRELSLWKHWRKLAPANREAKASRPDIATFHVESWEPGGIFRDVISDDQHVAPLVATGTQRLAIPRWDNQAGKCVDCRLCLKGCPQAAIRRRESGNGSVYSENDSRCIGCGICAAICPESVWQIHS